MNSPNPKLPEVSREYLRNPTFRQAVIDYTSDAYSTINRYLREGGRLEQRDRMTHEALAAAFAELRPFAKPIKVYRAIHLSADGVRSFAQSLLNVRNAGTIIQLKGYVSCSTNPASSALKAAPLRFVILTHSGLDAKPASASAFEDEVNLDHDSAFEVRKVRRPSNAGQAAVKLEQLIL